MRRRLALLPLVLVASVAATGCAGKTTGATEITRTSAHLNAVGSCETTCEAFFSIEFPTTCTASGCIGGGLTTQKFSIGAIKPTAFRASVNSLEPGRTYRYQVCGKEAGWSNFVCVGPDGTPRTKHSFTTKR